MRNVLTKLRSLASVLLHRDDFEESMREEMRFHRDAYEDQLIRGGASPAEARRRSAVAFGSVPSTQEECREARGVRVIEELRQDIRYAARQLARSPAFTAGVVASLALGIGINTAMFGILDRVLLRSPNFLGDSASVNRAYFSWNAPDGKRLVHRTVEYRRFLHMRQWLQSASDVAGFAYRPVPVGDGVDTRQALIVASSANFFEFFNAKPVIGRFFTAAEDQLPAGQPVAVLAFTYWQTQYAGDRRVLGRSLRIGTVPYTIVGVAPRGFDGVAD